MSATALDFDRVEIAGVTNVFGPTRALSGVNATLEAGCVTVLRGPNGSGKSTLVAAIAGLLPLERGRVVLGGTVLDDQSTHVPVADRPIGVVFQELRLFPHLSALENVAFPLRARGAPRAEARVRAREMLERLEIVERAAARPAELSGGKAQRVALARALVSRPDVLLLEEPLSALDVGARARIRALLRTELAAFPGLGGEPAPDGAGRRKVPGTESAKAP